MNALRFLDGILLCGSSALLPQVQQALAQEFPDTELVLLGDAEELQGAVARGAALQALAVQVFGEPLIAPVCSSELSLRVSIGQVPLLRAGDAVPAASAAPIRLRRRTRTWMKASTWRWKSWPTASAWWGAGCGTCPRRSSRTIRWR